MKTLGAYNDHSELTGEIGMIFDPTKHPRKGRTTSNNKATKLEQVPVGYISYPTQNDVTRRQACIQEMLEKMIRNKQKRENLSWGDQHPSSVADSVHVDLSREALIGIRVDKSLRCAAGSKRLVKGTAVRVIFGCGLSVTRGSDADSTIAVAVGDKSGAGARLAKICSGDSPGEEQSAVVNVVGGGCT